MNETPPNNTQELNALMALASLQKQVKGGASNFYWIAALSVINSLGAVFELGVSFVIGLGVTQVVDALAMIIAEGLPEYVAIVRTVGVVVSIAVSDFFTSDIQVMSPVSSFQKTRFGVRNLDKKRTLVEGIKSFPLNTEC